ncbi:MAG: DoxX family protein [Mucilaginibacter sp.]|nr:DoxX family protein [Mucilaginibacter sp.]
MQILIFIGLFILGGLLNFIINLKASSVGRVAKGYIYLALLLSINVWIFYFLGIKSTIVLNILSSIMSWGGMVGHLILGYLMGNILFALEQAETPSDNYPIKEINRLTLWGLSILTGNLFILATVGKMRGFAEMTAFFTTSGYGIWFLYFIMSAEALGGLGILLHFKIKTGPVATTGLMLIMLGAVYTHWHNKDPFSDSYAAVMQFITLSLILILYYFEKRANCKPTVTSIYIV